MRTTADPERVKQLGHSHHGRHATTLGVGPSSRYPGGWTTAATIATSASRVVVDQRIIPQIYSSKETTANGSLAIGNPPTTYERQGDLASSAVSAAL